MPELSDNPNIVLLYVDQMRSDAMRCAGNMAIQTPNLDRLAAEGVRFTDCVSTTPVCIATRYHLLTGRRSGETGRYANNNVDPEPLLDTIPSMLGHAGYYNYSLGKMHFLPSRRHYGFHHREVMDELPTWNQDDDYLCFLKEKGWGHKREIHGVRNLLYCQPQTSPLPQEMHGSWWMGDRMLDFLRLNHNRRFFAWLGWIGPHPPYNVPEPWASMYANADVPFPVAVDRDEETMPFILRNLRSYSDYDNASDERLRRVVALYYAAISLIDHQVGRILDTLDELELTDNTLVVFMSDHGEMLGDYRTCQKANPYEQAEHVPLIMRWPERLPAGGVSDHLVNATDMLPTFMDAAGYDHPMLDTIEGMSLLGASRGGHAHPRSEIVTDYGAASYRWLSLRRPPLKYNYYCDNGFEELYNLADDPHELHNLLIEGASGARATADEMRRALVDWETANGLPEGSLDGDDFRDYGQTEPAFRRNNQFPQWVDYCSDEERAGLEAPGMAIEEALAREDSFDIEELDLKWFKEHGGSLDGSRWEGLLEKY
jgi:arylsulfatase A-like enzyme